MIPGWPAGQVAISVALLVDQADQIQKAQGSELDGDQFCELVQDAVSYTHLTLPTTPYV